MKCEPYCDFGEWKRDEKSSYRECKLCGYVHRWKQPKNVNKSTIGDIVTIVNEGDSAFVNATLPAPNNLRSYMILRDGIGNPVGLIIDPTLDGTDVEIMLGLQVETVFIEQDNPVADIVSRIAGM